MEKFTRLFKEELEDDELISRYHDLVAILLVRLSGMIDDLPEEIADTVFELAEISDELSMDDDEYEEDTTADAVGDFKPPLFNTRKKKICEDETLDEVAVKRIKRDKALRLQRRKEYRRNRSKLKLVGKKLRRTAKFKKYLVKKKRFGKRGLTVSKKRVRKFIN